MEMREIVGYSREDLATALEVMESSIAFGEKARITICTEGMPTEEELDYMFLGMVETGCHVSQPTARLIDGIPTTEFDLQKGSPQWQVIIPVLVPLFIIGLIAFGITKLEAISKALLPLVIVGTVGLVALAIIVRRPTEKYLERAGTLPRFPATISKSTLPEPLQKQVRAALRQLPTWKLKEAYEALQAGQATGIDVVEQNRSYAINAIADVLWERGKLPATSKKAVAVR